MTCSMPYHQEYVLPLDKFSDDKTVSCDVGSVSSEHTKYTVLLNATV